MKKTLLFGIFLSICLMGFPQKRGPLVTEEQKQVVQTAYRTYPIVDLGNLEQPGNSTVMNTDYNWYLIGNTDFDLQSNASVSNRYTKFNDGTKAAVYIYGPSFTGPDFPELGTVYAYFDGVEWITEGSIESDRAAWPTHAPWGEMGEIIVSQAAGGTIYTDGGLIINTRPTKGSGEWTESLLLGPAGFEAVVWPRMVTSGENFSTVHIIHMLNQEYMGMKDALLYNRSSDGGQTWDILHTQLDGLTEDDYSQIGADSYTFAHPLGENIAFCIASPWYTDLLIMKSENNGDDWDKTIVWEHPYPFFEWETTIFTDTLWAPDGAADIAIDEDGMVHLVASLCRIGHFEAGNTYSYWPYGEGVIYWNEDRPAFEDENQHNALNAWDPEILEPDVELIGWGQDWDGDGEFTLYNDDIHTYRTIGASTMPSISCGDWNTIVAAWAGVTEVDIYNETYNYRRIWTRVSTNGANTWNEHFNINTDITMSFDECIYPCLLSEPETGFWEEVNLIYQADWDIGTAVDGDHDYVNNRIPTGLAIYGGVNDFKNESVNRVSQNYPNPATTTTKINIDLPETGTNLSIEVSNLVGQVVYSKDLGTVRNKQTSIVLDVSDFTPGVYFYTVKVSEKSVTRKMIVE